jgi:hypothetical protein
VPDYLSALGQAHTNLAWRLHGQGDREGACRNLEQAIGHQRAALRGNPLHFKYRSFLRDNEDFLANVLLEMGNHTEAAVVAEDLFQVVSDVEDANPVLRAAAYLVRCGEVATQDLRIMEEKRKELGQVYAAQAVGILRRGAIKGHLKDAREIDRPEFKGLRGREDFQRLRKLLEDRGKVGVG